MTEAARRRTRARIRLIKIQWLLILALIVALILSFVTRPSASVPDEPESSPVRVEAPEPITETSAPEPELIELGEFKTTAYCTCVKCCGIWSAEHPSRVGTDYVQRTKSGTIPTADRTVSVDPDVIPLGTVLIIDGCEYIAEDISDRFQVSKSQAGRLVMTESAAFANEARKDCFKDLGVEKYVIVETLDNETCSLCAQLDGKVYPMSEYQVGVTAPPFHPWCRGTTAPYYEDMQGLGDRFARDGEGKGYAVPRDMKFTDWKEKYVVQPEKTRYNIFKNAVLEELKGYSTSMHSGNQSKHIRGGQNFDPTRGELTVDPQMLYDQYSGKGQFLKTNAGDWNHKERFTHTEAIGIYRSKYTGKEVPTNTGIIHYSKRKGWHIVPARPQKGAAK